MRKREKEPMQSLDTHKALTVKESGREREGREESHAAKRRKEHRKTNAIKEL